MTNHASVELGHRDSKMNQQILFDSLQVLVLVLS